MLVWISIPMGQGPLLQYLRRCCLHAMCGGEHRKLVTRFCVIRRV